MMQKMATPKQLAYIERLSSDNEVKIEKPLRDLTIEEASDMIGALLVKANPEKSEQKSKSTNWGTGARIGLAFKVCYQHYSLVSNINIPMRKKEFKQSVIDTYHLLNEIAEELEAT